MHSDIAYLGIGSVLNLNLVFPRIQGDDGGDLMRVMSGISRTDSELIKLLVVYQ